MDSKGVLPEKGCDSMTPRTCQHCAELEEQIAIATANFTRHMIAARARLDRAVQRESIHYDVRAVHDARNTIERHDAGFLERSRRRNR